MNLRHEEVLADIERRVRSDGASLDEIDGRIAAELGVPTDYYFAYLLVWGAIEAYRDGRDLTEPGWLDATSAGGPTLEAAQSLASTIGWLASTIYQETVEPSGDGQGVADHAAKILGAVLQLRQALRDVGPPSAQPIDGDGQTVRP